MFPIQTHFAGRPVTREAFLAWENHCIDAASKRLGTHVPDGAVHLRRETFLEQKLDLGATEIARRLRRDTEWSDRIALIQAKMSARRRLSTIDLVAPTGTAEEVEEFFSAAATDEAAMLRACPDHYAIRMGPDGQEVLETTGGSPLAARFVIDYDDVSSLVTPPDPAWPVQVAGVARAAEGTAIGGVRHQFRTTKQGFEARLTVEFPLPTLPTMVRGHRWHLACEFSNWIEAAFPPGSPRVQ